MMTATRTCECGCSGTPRPGNRFLRGHHQGTTAVAARHYSRDDRAIAFYTGAADRRYGRPRRVDVADTSMLGDAYTRGYDGTGAA